MSQKAPTTQNTRKSLPRLLFILALFCALLSLVPAWSFAGGSPEGSPAPGSANSASSASSTASALVTRGAPPIASAPEVVTLRADDGLVLDQLIAKHYEDSMQVAFGTFTYEYTGLPSSFSRYLEEALSFLISRSDKYRLFNRNVAAAMDPAFRESYKDFFETNQVGGLLSGRFFDEGNRVRVRIELTNLRDGNLVGSGDLVRLKSELPPRISLEPAKETQATAKDAAGTSDKLQTSQTASGGKAAALPVVKWASQSKPGGLSVAVSTDRGPGASYVDGEEMAIYVTANHEAYLKVYHIDVNGNIQLIWPNRFGGGSVIRPGAPVPIPAPGDPFVFRLGPPYGTEFIKVVASTVPFTQTESDFSSLGTDVRGVLERGLSVVGTATPETAEALASYYIGPKVTTVFE